MTEDKIAAMVPKRLHRIVFGGEGIWGVRAFCEGCGWQVATRSPTQSDAVYWSAREHLARLDDDRTDDE